jgi:peptidoglycan/xylan/chitin deacetylase (PgdA/CDA1 family)
MRERFLSIPDAQNDLVRSLAGSLDVNLDQYVKAAQPYLSSDQVRAMLKHGFTIGAHSHDHPLYADLSLADQLTQTRKSMEFLRAKFGVSPKAFAFPHSDEGVDEAFFHTVFSEQLLDVSFGTRGLVSHFHPRNIERVSMEKTSAPASRILARQFARATYFRFRAYGKGRLRPLAKTTDSGHRHTPPVRG